jgi:hypothetical protein
VGPRAIDLKSVSDLTGGLTLEAEHDGLQTQGHARGFVGLSLLAEGFEVSQGADIAAGEDGGHRRERLLCYLCARHSSTLGYDGARKKGTLNQKTTKPE